MDRFFKYEGLGNDFVVLDRRSSGADIDAQTTRQLCDRHFGIGADGVLTILPEPGTAGRMVVHNADGSIAEMCGNGLRCVVRYLAESAGHRPRELLVATGAGALACEIAWGSTGAEQISVAMGPARLVAPILPASAPFIAQPVEGYAATAVSMGNPHLVLLDAPHDLAPTLGRALEGHAGFPQRTNVEFVLRTGEGLDVVVWERGVGLTLACGTGACASVVAAALAGKAPYDAWVPVRLPGGLLSVKVAADLSQVWLRGPARRVFEGSVEA